MACKKPVQHKRKMYDVISYTMSEILELTPWYGSVVTYSALGMNVTSWHKRLDLRLTIDESHWKLSIQKSWRNAVFMPNIEFKIHMNVCENKIVQKVPLCTSSNNLSHFYLGKFIFHFTISEAIFCSTSTANLTAESIAAVCFLFDFVKGSFCCLATGKGQTSLSVKFSQVSVLSVDPGFLGVLVHSWSRGTVGSWGKALVGWQRWT